MINYILSFIVTFFIITSEVYAQADNEIINGILRAILGDLPQPCSNLGSATCTYCIGYLKLLPFAFFFGFFYLMFVFITYGIRGSAGFSLSRTPSIHVAILIIAALLSLFLLHTQVITSALTRVESFMGWVNWGISLLTFMLAYLIATKLFNHFWNFIGALAGLWPEFKNFITGVWFQAIFRLIFTVIVPFAIMLYIRSQLPDTGVGNLLFGEQPGKIFDDVKVCIQ